MAAAPIVNQVVDVSRQLASLLLAWSWQMLLVLAAAWLAIKFDRSRSAATRYRVWLIAILVSAILPLLSMISKSLPGPPLVAPLPAAGTAVLPAPSTLGLAGPRFLWGSLVWPICVLLWATGIAIQLGRLFGSHLRLRAIQRSARSESTTTSSLDIDWEPGDVNPKIGRQVTIAFSGEIKSPGLAGLFRPVILLPADIATWTNPEERASILRHELAHINRRDHLASLLQSIFRALFFFHPMVRYASNQLSLERELACDDRVLGMGTEPDAYAESILKAAERSFINDVVHQTASFASKRKLERRIDMILDPDRAPLPLRQWPFLILPLLLMGTITWIVMPAASGTPRPRASAALTSPPAPSSTASSQHSQAPAVVDRQNVWIDTVIRDNLVMRIRALGTLKPGNDGRFLAALQVPEVMSPDLELGQPAAADTGIGVVTGEVGHIYPEIKNGTRRVDIFLKGELPAGVSNALASAGGSLQIDGTIEIGHLDNVLNIGRPVNGQADSIVTLFKLAEDGASASRVQVRLGRSSVNRVEVVDGLKDGDRVIISDMSAYSGYDSITLK